MGGHYFSLSFVISLIACRRKTSDSLHLWMCNEWDRRTDTSVETHCVQLLPRSDFHSRVAKRVLWILDSNGPRWTFCHRKSTWKYLPIFCSTNWPTVTRIQGLGGSEHHSPRIAVLESGLCDTQIEGQLGWNIHRRDEVVFNTHFTPGHSWPHTLIGLTRNFTRLMEGSVGMYRCYGWSNLPFPVEISPSSDPDFDSSLPAWKSCVLICLTWMSI